MKKWQLHFSVLLLITLMWGCSESGTGTLVSTDVDGIDTVDTVDTVNTGETLKGKDGISIVWKGELASAPDTPQLNWAYYNTTDKMSYIWDGTEWDTLSVDGTDGTNGTDGTDGTDGTNGTNGVDGISVIWKGELDAAPETPELNWAYFNTESEISYIYNGTDWDILARAQSYKMPPVVRFITNDTTVFRGSSIKLRAMATDPADRSRAIASSKAFVWSFDGGETYTDTTDTGEIVATFTEDGDNLIWVKVIDDDGLESQPAGLLVTSWSFAQASLMSTYSYILRTDGTLWITGDDGQPTSAEKTVPRLASVSPNYDIASLYYASILTTDGTLIQLSTDEVIMTDLKSVSGTKYLKTNGTLWGEGNNEYGQLGDGTTDNKDAPVEIMSDVASVSATLNHTMIVKTDGTLWATGLNDKGQLGDGTTENKLTPVQIMSDVASVSAGSDYTMIVKTDGTLWGTGENSGYQLGDGTTEDKLTPVEITTDVASVFAVDNHTFVLKNDGTLLATGVDDESETTLGHGNSYYRLITKLTTVASDVADVFVSNQNTMILKTDGTLWGTGVNDLGQLGDGTTTNAIYGWVQVNY